MESGKILCYNIVLFSLSFLPILPIYSECAIGLNITDRHISDKDLHKVNDTIVKIGFFLHVPNTLYSSVLFLPNGFYELFL